MTGRHVAPARAAVAAAVIVVATPPAWAQQYPVRPVKIKLIALELWRKVVADAGVKAD